MQIPGSASVPDWRIIRNLAERCLVSVSP